mmetsp:Transcript_79452/g.226880  ORF Transcript_79452/g.226880 Transcript_79452/m.226880 type:complete len:288 (-) Transcript_79452:31-894(-)
MPLKMSGAEAMHRASYGTMASSNSPPAVNIGMDESQSEDAQRGVGPAHAPSRTLESHDASTKFFRMQKGMVVLLGLGAAFVALAKVSRAQEASEIQERASAELAVSHGAAPYAFSVKTGAAARVGKAAGETVLSQEGEGSVGDNQCGLYMNSLEIASGYADDTDWWGDLDLHAQVCVGSFDSQTTCNSWALSNCCEAEKDESGKSVTFDQECVDQMAKTYHVSSKFYIYMYDDDGWWGDDEYICEETALSTLTAGSSQTYTATGSSSSYLNIAYDMTSVSGADNWNC